MSHNRRQRSKRLRAPSVNRHTRRRKNAGSGKTSLKHRGKSAANNTTERSSYKYPVLKFLLTFGILLAVFYIFVAFSPSYHKKFIPPYHHLIAQVSGGMLAVLGQDITVADASISSPSFAVQIVSGCDAVEAIALFVCAVLAFPLKFLKKLPGMIAGTLLLSVLNLVRVVSLFLVGVYSPRIFALMHIDVWQAIFIFFAVLLWILWLLWATRSQVVAQSASS
jgi:exosortase H (IPTLxxWG-CTERM-specific)